MYKKFMTGNQWYHIMVSGLVANHQATHKNEKKEKEKENMQFLTNIRKVLNNVNLHNMNKIFIE
jgi:hypothetical protein